MKKRGQGLSTTAIILIILGIIILVVLVIGFSVGWGKILPFVSNSNVDSIATQCSTACTQNSVFEFCTKGRDLNNGTATLKSVNCYYLAEKQQQYGIESCPGVTASCANVFVSAADAADLQTKCADNEGKTVQALIGNKLESYPCPATSP